MGLMAAAMVLALASEPVVIVGAREPSNPEHMDLQFNAKCGGHSLQLTGIGYRLPKTTPPRLTLDNRPIALPAAATAFLSKTPSSYQLFATCDKKAPTTIYFRMYRISSEKDGAPDYAVYGLDLKAGEIVRDTGEIAADADSFF